MRQLYPYAFVLALAQSPASAQLLAPTLSEIAGVSVIHEISYGNSLQNKLDVCRPKGNILLPAVILIHGGSWFGGDRQSLSGVCAKLAAEGLAAINVDYRLAALDHPDNQWPAQEQDVASALAYIETHRAQFSIDTARVCIYGESAGAHLAVFATAYIGNAAVRCVIDCFGPMDIDAAPLLHKAARMLLGIKDEKYRRGEFYKISPVHHLTAGSTTMLVVQGDKDTLVNAGQSRVLLSRLRNLNVPYTYLEYSGGHNWSGLSAIERMNIFEYVRAYMVDRLQ